MLLALAADRTEVLIDAEDDEDELRTDLGEDHADECDQHAPDDGDEADDRAREQRPQAAENALQAGEHRHDDGEPVEHLDDRRRDETFPLEKVANIEHAALLSAPSGGTRTALLVDRKSTRLNSS